MKTARSRRLHRLLAPALEQLPIFPLDQVQLFPRALLPLYVFEPRYRELTAACLERGGIMAVAALRPGFRDDYYGRPPVRRIAGVGKIVAHRKNPDGTYNIGTGVETSVLDMALTIARHVRPSAEVQVTSHNGQPLRQSW